MKYVVLILATLVAFSATAQGMATLTFTPPNMFTDGSALNPATELVGYGVFVDGSKVATAPNTATSYVVEGLSYGSHEFWLTAIAKNGHESAMSNTTTKVIVDDRTPRPPTLLEVIIAFLKRLFAHFV